jgi:uncharacterized iron-regulated protein
MREMLFAIFFPLAKNIEGSLKLPYLCSGTQARALLSIIEVGRYNDCVKHFVWWTLLILFGLILSVGCAKRIQPPWISKIAMIREPIGTEEIFRLPGGDPISFHQLLSDLEPSSVIFMGETHDQIEHHQNQVRILQGLIGKNRDIVVGMEMFEKSQQPILDQWTEGKLSEEEFLKEIKWEATWGMDYNLYKGILDEAKTRRLKVLCLNIERELVRRVGQQGIAGLSPEDRAKLPEMDLSDKDHRRYMASIYRNHHGGSAKDFENFYEAQCLWDEAMAETLSRFLLSGEGRGKTVLVIAGSGHVAFDFGIPKRLHRRTPSHYKTIILKEWKKNVEGDFNVNKVSSPLAHFLWITKPTPPEKKRPRIGVLLRETEDPKGIWMERVIPGSPAEKAGFLSGDQFLAIDGKEVTKVKEIQDALAEKGWGKKVTVTILREGLKKEITVILPSLEE